MIITKQDKPFDMVAIRNTFTDSELSEIWKELEFLTREDVLLPPADTGSALDDESNSWKKSNSGIFMNELYVNKNVSPINNHSEKIITNNEVFEAMVSCSPVHELIKNVNQRSILISYYEDADFYDTHKDSSAYTAVTYLFKEPRKFDGGSITFSVNGSFITFEVENNMTVFFPSCYDHEVERVSMSDNDKFSTNGRYAISQFLGIGFNV